MDKPSKKGPPGLGLLIGLGKPSKSGEEAMGEDMAAAEDDAGVVAAEEFAAALKSGDGQSILDAFNTLLEAAGVFEDMEEEPAVEAVEEEES